MLKYKLCIAATIAISLISASAPARAAEPLDLLQSYNGTSAVAVAHIETYNTYANGSGTTNSFAFDAGAFSFDDPFLKSSANPPMLTFFAGVSTDVDQETGEQGDQHLVLALTSAYAAGLVSGQQDFAEIFPNYGETDLIHDLIDIDGGTSDQSAIDAARQELVDFFADVESRGGLTPAFGGPLTLLAFSSAVPVGTGMSSIVPVPVGGAVPEPASWAMMISGFGLVGVAARRTRREVEFAV